jgi:hypothetical protein
MFKDVPLIKINTKDINVKIPAMTSEEITKYQSYLKTWSKKNGQILTDWTNALNQLLAMCGTTDKAEAKKTKATLEAQLATIPADKNLSTDEKVNLTTRINSELKDMNRIIALPEDTTRHKL